MKKLTYVFIAALSIMAIACTKSNSKSIVGFWSGTYTESGGGIGSFLFKSDLTSRFYNQPGGTALDTSAAYKYSLTYFVRGDSVFATSDVGAFNGKIVDNQIMGKSGVIPITLTKQ